MECPRCHAVPPPAALTCAGCAAPLRLGEEPPPARLDRELDLDRRAARREPEPRGTPAALVPRAEEADPLAPAAPAPHLVEDEGGAPAPAPLRAAAGAALLDAAFIALATGLPLLAAALSLPGGCSAGALLPAGGALAALVAVAYGALGHALAGATPGELLLGLVAVQADGGVPGMGQAAARAALALAGTAALGAGLWLALFTESRRPLHDRVTGTYAARAP